MSEQVIFRRKLDREDFERMNLPSAYWKVKVHGAPQSVREPILRYLKGIDRFLADGVGLLVVGNPGVGKTALAALCAKEARSRGYTVLFTTVWEMREAIRARVPFETDETLLQRAQKVDLLILDDLRVDDVKQGWFGRSEIEAIVAARAAGQKATIITSQMGYVDLRRDLPALMDSAQGCMVTMAVSGPNLRESRREELKKAIFG